MTKIKICGLTRMGDIACVNRLKPEYIGFVFARRSSRYVPPETAAMLKAALSPKIQAVGVFVNAPAAYVAALLDAGVINAAQLHGNEDDAYLRTLKARTGTPVIQAFRIHSTQDAARAQRSSADFVLLDSGFGGTGQMFDRSLISAVRRPFFLAGGLSPETVAKAIAETHPYAVDASTLLESGGRKDAEKIKRFIDAVRTPRGKE